MTTGFIGGGGGGGDASLGSFLVASAAERWLYAEEIFIILSGDPACIGLNVSGSNPVYPQSGQLYIYQGSDVSFKNDGVDYAKKKGQDRPQETYQNINVNGADTIRGIYSRAAQNPHFKRRIYRLSDRAKTPIFLVHYREMEDERPENKYVLSAAVQGCFNT
eukprot:CAMPEP_0173330350 /NCGR_PEP_ID=MMETSP1144-20121109/3202_1 /TAXON_ID=483371 /ORGANISM="non described non described, Strain CCMP2298" /LENGTH=161 /DNA_ID=CAMNT_0014275021 /DNA_START=101 /DNA_END=582 /DNA_ORIENTATION=+